MKLAHWHLSQIALAEANSRLRSCPDSSLSILDIGCGVGELVGELHQLFMTEEIKVKVKGFEITEHGGSIEKWNQQILQNLGSVNREIDWNKHLKLVSSDEGFPYADNSFDIAMACQVLEHVHDLEQFFSECVRCLSEKGCLIAMFPLKEVVLEPHIKVPFVHWMSSRIVRQRCISLSRRLGLGVTRSRFLSDNNYESQVQRDLDYLEEFTNYENLLFFENLASRFGFKLSLGYSPQFYYAKMRQLLHMKLPVKYTRNSSLIDHLFSKHILRYISSLTLVFRKQLKS